ncbi:bicoid stability factor [Anticarsia gemmatalis]|uniref:bicoid stability factor n=1 Tax=Anticarsia gemmatalis TaxID=129554 RepID=UPI003F76664B
MSSLLRSTKFVRYFTGAARTLILNSAKTAEANLLINPKALSAANNVLLRDYATSKKPESLEPLLQKLDSEVKRFGRITKKDIDEVFDEIKSKNDITSSQSLLVIRCCGELVPEELPEQRTLLVQKIWSVLTERGIPMDISHYNALLRVYIENEHPFSPALFLEELEKKGLQPNRVTYQRLMWRYCQEGDVEGATKVLEKMRELNMPVSEPVLNALVMGHSFHGDTEGAKAVLETMAAAGLKPTNKTYTLLACGYARKGDMEGVQKTIQTAQDSEDVLSDRDILEIIEHLAVSGHDDKVEQLFPHLQKSIGYNQDVCNLVLRLLNKGQLATSIKVMKTMPKLATSDDTIFKGAFFIRQLVKLNKSADEIIATCKQVKDDGLVPYAIFIATEAALTNGQTELAQKLFSELKNEGLEIRPHYYWPLLAQKGKEGDEEGMLQILRDMTANSIPASGEALRDYVIPSLLKNDTPQNVILKLQIANIPVIHSARNVMVELLEKGNIKKAADIALQYRPRGNYALVARSLIGALSRTKDIDSFVTILHVISSKGPGSPIEEDSANDDAQSESNNVVLEVSRIVRASIKNLANPELCEKLLQGVFDKGLRISTETAENIEQYLGEKLTTNISQLLTKLTSADLEVAPLEGIKQPNRERTTTELEALLKTLKSKGNVNLNRLQKQLLQAYIKENNVKKVNSFLEELKASNFELTTPTLAQLFEFYCENDDVDKAQEINAQLKERSPEFFLSRYKLVLMAYALVRANRVDEAIQFVKNNRHEDKPEGSNFMLNSKSWQMLNTLAEQKQDVKVREMTNALIESRYIEPSNVILGPSIKVHLLKEDIPSALKEFERFCTRYRSTPWKGELMKALIMQEDAARLQWLADLSTQIHGEVNILHDLVLAFVECGRLRQARRILETPGMQTRHRRLDDACQRYVEEGKSEYLEGLLEATKELSHIDRSNIFYHLLVTYCKANETDKALGLWTVLQEDGEVPSEQFLQYLANHLKSNNRPVPFAVPNEPSEAKDSKIAKQKNIVDKIVTRKEPTKPTKFDVSNNIETLTKNGQVTQAMDVAIKSIEHGVVPKTSVLKFVLKALAEAGNVEKIQQFGNYINESLKRRVTYNDKLTQATFSRGAGSQHIDNLLENVQAAKTEEDLTNALKRFPRSNSLSNVINDSELETKCTKIAEIAASRGITLPANLLWMEFVLSGKEKEAESLWTQYLSSAPNVVFRRLLQESHVRKEPQIIEKLLQLLKTRQHVTKGSLGNAYSRLVNYYLVENQIKEAEDALSAGLKEGLTLEDFNKTTITRLKTAVSDAGRELKV